MKPFWRKTWGAMNGVGLGALGATTFYGEFGQYNDQFGAGEQSLCRWYLGYGRRTSATSALIINGSRVSSVATAFVTGSEVQRWGLGVVQEIDAAAMHVWASWQHQELDDLSMSAFPRIAGD